jgi:hypothetical protein
MPKITAKFIETGVTFPAKGQSFIRDDELKGFGLRVTKGRVSFVVESRTSGKFRRITLGQYGTMTPDEARKKARQLLSGPVAIEATTAKLQAVTCPSDETRGGTLKVKVISLEGHQARKSLKVETSDEEVVVGARLFSGC